MDKFTLELKDDLLKMVFDKLEKKPLFLYVRLKRNLTIRLRPLLFVLIAFMIL